MATASQSSIEAEIINVDNDPKHPGRTLVSVQFDDGRGPWVQAFSLLPPPRPMTPEEFMVLLKDEKIERPVANDPFIYIREAQGEKYKILVHTDEATER